MPCPRLTLSNTSPEPSVVVTVGSCLDVVVPAWHNGSPTNVTVTPGGLLQEETTTLEADGTRLTTFSVGAVGTARLAATIAPATGLFMPAWGGRVVVMPQPPSR